MGWNSEKEMVCIRCNKEFLDSFDTLRIASGEYGKCPYCGLKDGTMPKPMDLVKKTKENKCISRLSDIFK